MTIVMVHPPVTHSHLYKYVESKKCEKFPSIKDLSGNPMLSAEVRVGRIGNLLVHGVLIDIE